VKPFFLFLGIDSLDAYSFPGLLHFDLDFFREGFCFLVRAGLRANRGRNLDVAAGLTVEPDATELVIDAHGLASTERYRLLKILRHLFLRGFAAGIGFAVKSSIVESNPATAARRNDSLRKTLRLQIIIV